jgi:hypothetical protein
MNELKQFFIELLHRVEVKTAEEVAKLKAAFEAEKQVLLADVLKLEEELKAKIEIICAPTSSVVPTIVSEPVVVVPIVPSIETAITPTIETSLISTPLISEVAINPTISETNPL